jgi:Protein of unknown function (DUF3060)
MQSQDDPEARIRELERPLADVARTSELGTEQHGSGYRGGAYLPPPVQAYGAQYAGAPQRAKSGLGAARWLFAGILIVLLVVGAGVAIYSARIFSLGSETRPPVQIPNVSGGGGQIDKAPGVGPIETVPSKEPSISSGVPIPPPGEQLSVSGVDENEIIACNESIVSVSGVNNTVTITGHCVSLTVSGVENVVTVDAADTIGASGFDNQVIYLSGSPEINATGSNVVGQG